MESTFGGAPPANDESRFLPGGLDTGADRAGEQPRLECSRREVNLIPP